MSSSAHRHHDFGRLPQVAYPPLTHNGAEYEDNEMENTRAQDDGEEENSERMGANMTRNKNNRKGRRPPNAGRNYAESEESDAAPRARHTTNTRPGNTSRPQQPQQYRPQAARQNTFSSQAQAATSPSPSPASSSPAEDMWNSASGTDDNESLMDVEALFPNIQVHTHTHRSDK